GRNKEFPIRLSVRYLPLLPGFAWRNQSMIKARTGVDHRLARRRAGWASAAQSTNVGAGFGGLRFRSSTPQVQLTIKAGGRGDGGLTRADRMHGRLRNANRK
ncbi:hypothetical protein, partial [Thiorhodococcus minor]|uniref:hypothetical protein n=1 Tax=Thiorhodococcus minor TaxID=57489 RepID=UPI001ADC20AB